MVAGGWLKASMRGTGARDRPWHEWAPAAKAAETRMGRMARAAEENPAAEISSDGIAHYSGAIANNLRPLQIGAMPGAVQRSTTLLRQGRPVRCTPKLVTS